MSGSNNDPHQPPNEQQAKRAAMAGQWRTPPLPAFSNRMTTATAAGSSTSTTTTLPPVPQVSVSNLPGSTEDYAKALQEVRMVM
jgi:hypothetical protein